MDNCGVAQHSSDSSFSGCAKNKIARLNPPEPLETLGVWIPRIHPLSHRMPTVFILTTCGARVKMQAETCKQMFQELCFSPLFIDGVEESYLLPKPRTHWAWALAFLPKVRMLCSWQGIDNKDAIILAENSCWPTDNCTPDRVREVLRDAVAQHGFGSWIGYAGCVNKKRTFQQTFDNTGLLVNVAAQCHAPRGSKLFVITKEGLEVLCKAFECAPTGWFVDTVNQAMIASGHLVLKRPALAGTMNHYSERCGKKVEENELAEKEGEFLMLGRIYDHVEC